MKEIIIGTRGSKLALTQVQWVMSRLQAIYPEITFQIRVIHTRGDKLTHANLAQAGGYGFFVKEIEDALLSKDIDLAVHSLKDMPAILPHGLKIGAICKRLDARDAFISKDGCKLEDIEPGSGIGTSSLRRQTQLKSFRPDLRVVDLRGNLDTRLKKLTDNRKEVAPLVGLPLQTELPEISGIIVAAAGLYRLKMEGKITQLLPLEPFLPAAGQGALALEVRNQDEIEVMVNVLNDQESMITVFAERAFLEKIGVGCAAPVGVYARIAGDKLIVRGMISEHWEESQTGMSVLHWEEIEGPPQDYRKIGLLLGERMVRLGVKKK